MLFVANKPGFAIMKDYMAIIKETIKGMARLIIKPLVILWFWVVQWFKHNKFLRFLNNSELGKPSVFLIPFIYIERFASFIKCIWTHEFSEHALKKYERFIRTHYSKKGVGYFNYGSLSDEERLKTYKGLTGRIAHYIENNAIVFDYKDGESFLDVGCGKGQNIKELVERYPNSLIKGFDVSEEALRVVRVALKGNRNVQVETGSAFDFKYLETYPAKSFDHIIVSHVFSFLIGMGIDETKRLRQILVDHLVRIASKTALIMDGNILENGDFPEVIIEQNTRCHFRESLVPYFSKHLSKGELYAVFSPENEGIIFRLKD